MPVVKGIRNTANIETGKIKIDMAETIAMLNPSATPFLTFLKKAKGNSQVANNPKFEWMEDDIGARWDAINKVAGFLSTDLALDVDTGDAFTPGDIVKVPRTGEVIFVSSIAANVLTVVRGYGTTAAAALVNDDPLVIVGNANQEGSGSREIRTTKETMCFNYTQIMKLAWGVTNTQNATSMFGGNDLSYQQKKKGIEHAIDIARAMYFGQKKLDTTGNHPVRTTGGLLSWLTANNYDASGQLTKDEFDQNIAEVIFKHGASEKLMLCSARVLSVINGWAYSKLQVDEDAKKIGLNIVKYVSPFGILSLVHEPLFEGAVYGGYAAILDPENIFYRPLKGRDTSLETNIQLPDEDLRKDQYITEAGLMVKLPKTHALLTGVTS